MSLAEVAIHFAPGESIHTENSYKFTNDSIAMPFEKSGFAIDNIWKRHARNTRLFGYVLFSSSDGCGEQITLRPVKPPTLTPPVDSCHG
jgi:hypothetical protein